MATLYNSKHRSWTTLNNGGSLSSGGTSVTVLSAASLPAAPFVATIEPGVTGQEEVVAVTGVTSNTLTLVRGLDGTTGVSHPDGCLIKNLSSSLAWSDMILLFKSHTHAGDGNTSLLPDYYAPRNAHPNGDFAVWQRGTSFASVTDGTWTADRWAWNIAGTGVVTITQDTSVPAVGVNAITTPFSLKIAVTTADTSIAAGELYALYSIIEGYDIRALTNGAAVSFWVKAHRTGIYCLGVSNFGTDRSYVAEYTINSIDTWEYKTIVIPAFPTAGTWNYANSKGLYIYFPLAMGSTYQTTPNAWGTGFHVATSNQINGVAATTDTLSLALVNIIPGSAPQPLFPVPFSLQMDRCQRYYEKLGGTGAAMICRGYSATAGLIEHYYLCHTKKGGTPTIGIVGTWTVTNCAQPLSEGTSADGFSLYSTVTAGPAEAKFYCADATTYVTVEWNP